MYLNLTYFSRICYGNFMDIFRQSLKNSNIKVQIKTEIAQNF